MSFIPERSAVGWEMRIFKRDRRRIVILRRLPSINTQTEARKILIAIQDRWDTRRYMDITLRPPKHGSGTIIPPAAAASTRNAHRDVSLSVRGALPRKLDFIRDAMYEEEGRIPNIFTPVPAANIPRRQSCRQLLWCKFPADWKHRHTSVLINVRLSQKRRNNSRKNRGEY